jgi:predicted ArsR family transcriptional regulator
VSKRTPVPGCDDLCTSGLVARETFCSRRGRGRPRYIFRSGISKRRPRFAKAHTGSEFLRFL